MSATATADIVNFLLVDDLSDNLVALQALLAQPDRELLLAHSGREALELLLQHDFALALVDVHMPEIDGFELAELMRGAERTRHVPIMFVTASDHEAARREFVGYEAGAVDFLFKPVDPHVLRSKVNVFVQLHRQRRELQRRVEELTRVREELSSTLRLNELFVAAVGHDLRTPLSAILSGTEVVRATAKDPLTQRAAETIRNSGKSMERLIADLFDLSRARLGGGIAIERSLAVDLGELSQHVIAEAKATAESRDFNLVLLGDLEGAWDAVRVQQVLANLVGNAVRHGKADKPIEVHLDGRTTTDVTIEVANGGVIPKEVLPHIFDPFRTFTTTERRKPQGLGLGLYIVREIVSAHGGEIVATTANETTRVQVRLPRGQAPIARAS
ncbi:MAG: hybrid sensor histidine kinase/response regulator [Clostridia bacterium]|nr:hybrid sensor histidine kinase/response regulator [Deltaproteobacteria bacterium]